MTIFTCVECGLERKLWITSEKERDEFKLGFVGECVRCHAARTFKPKQEEIEG